MVLHSSDSLNRVPVAIVVPGTTKLAAQRFAHTVRVAPDALNGLAQDTVFIGFQVQAADLGWIKEPPLGHLSAVDLAAVEDCVLDALGFDMPDAKPEDKAN